MRSPWRDLAITVSAALPIVFLLPRFFAWLGARPGIIPPEPLLPRLPAMDVSVPLFIVLYGCIVSGLVLLVRHPQRLLRALRAYVVLLLLRMATMAAWPLEVPPGYLPLQDPVSTLFYPGQVPFGRDLFFSGHTATMYLLFLAVPGPGWRWLFAMATVVVGLAVLFQHVHWTVDVVAAPVFAWAAWRIAAIALPAPRRSPGGHTP
ncbi:MAG: hypothetical protein KIT10_05065 [Flavobacteriales bacterium]|nr:hypothetical protein [Flavobacteriales bacterium]